MHTWNDSEGAGRLNTQREASDTAGVEELGRFSILSGMEHPCHTQHRCREWHCTGHPSVSSEEDVMFDWDHL